MEWNMGRRGAMLLLVAGLLGGCAQVPRQAFNAEGAAHVKKVVLVHHENQKD